MIFVKVDSTVQSDSMETFRHSADPDGYVSNIFVKEMAYEYKDYPWKTITAKRTEWNMFSCLDRELK